MYSSLEAYLVLKLFFPLFSHRFIVKAHGISEFLINFLSQLSILHFSSLQKYLSLFSFEWIQHLSLILLSDLPHFRLEHVPLLCKSFVASLDPDGCELPLPLHYVGDLIP